MGPQLGYLMPYKLNMTKEEFYSQVEVADGVRLRFFTEKPRTHILGETCARIKAVGGVIPNIPILEVHRFLNVTEILQKDFGRTQFKYSDAYNIYREGINRADYAAKTGRLG